MPRIRTKKKKPEAVVHDRKAVDVLKALQADLAVVEFDDPLERGARNNVVVSLRDDPLMRYKVRGFIDEAQFQAGRQWQDCYEAIELGRGQGIDYSQPKVDCHGKSDPMTDRRMRATDDLKAMSKVLGMTGEAIFRKVLGERKFMAQVVKEFGYSGTQREIDGFSLMFRVGLEAVAVARGLATPKPQRLANS